jgi:hypothetical protein
MNQRTNFSISLVVLSLALGLTLSACSGELDSSDPGQEQEQEVETITSDAAALTTGNAAMVTTTLYQSAAEIVNPERGYYVGYNILSPSGAATVRSSGHTVAIAIVRLDNYRDKALDSAFLNQLTTGFAAARANGIKLVLRFAYNASMTADASKARILGHISQLAPILKANGDVIAVMQAGFIGAWGEWHSSTNGLENNTDRAAILNALLAALPANRSVQVRTPMFKAGIYGSTAVTSTEAFSNTARARIGHHNDCFLASASDMGTYASPIATWEAYTGADTQFVPMGGETCAVSTRSTCAPALAEMAANHWSFLNQAYLATVVTGWDTGGCGAEIRKRLGYRFAMKRVAVNSKVRPGGTLDLEVDVKNYGFAAPFNARPVYVVLSNASGVHQVVKLSSVDVRRFAPATTTTIATKLHIPANLAAGTYKLSLWMPDEATSLQRDPRYALRMANDGVWDAATGENLMTAALHVDASAPGTVTTSTTFAVVP